jgi:hypothetical protein
MNAHLIAIALASFAITAAVCGISSTLVLARAVDEVNAMLPPAERFSPFGWHWWKYRRLVQEYYRLHPSGRRVAQLRSLNLAMVIVSVVAGVALIGLALGAFFGAVGGGVMWLTYRRNTAA